MRLPITPPTPTLASAWRADLGEEEEAALVRRATAGDEVAFARLVERYGPPILSLCLASTLDREVAEELSQDVFVRAWQGLAAFRADAAFSTWLFAIARNACLDAARRRRARPRTERLDDWSGAIATETQNAKPVLVAAARLSPPLRVALLMREIQGLSYEEIAELQDVPIGTVRSRIAAARSTVAEELRRQ
ncbi:MAG TPA: sigma-70 family RNA polymerase sigma factor [Microbacteriaceae bacterium]|nr:sigma-70 family RNA polymerase sigma factor [Microbacteriaceae bacterium]